MSKVQDEIKFEHNIIITQCLDHNERRVLQADISTIGSLGNNEWCRTSYVSTRSVPIWMLFKTDEEAFKLMIEMACRRNEKRIKRAIRNTMSMDKIITELESKGYNVLPGYDLHYY